MSVEGRIHSSKSQPLHLHALHRGGCIDGELAGWPIAAATRTRVPVRARER